MVICVVFRFTDIADQIEPSDYTSQLWQKMIEYLVDSFRIRCVDEAVEILIHNN